uniref:Ig-like domain-containing protein n=1 Tax=Timema tahoe TaxID=61484 RepID=A0A7R9NV37_9NEOP|nr:unnamed protein product [Timema tahoe]
MLSFTCRSSGYKESTQPPRFTIQPSSSGSIVSEGRTKILQCQAQDMGLFQDLNETTVTVESGQFAVLKLPPIESYPPPLVTWQTPDSDTLYDRKFALTGDKLVILSADKGDQNSYREALIVFCLSPCVRREALIVFCLSPCVRREALIKPTFLTNMRIETLGEYGSTLSLPCEVVGVPKPNIVWFRNTDRVETLVGDRFSVAEDGSLVIKRVRMEDSGMFQCLAANEAGEGSIYTWLKVKKLYAKPRLRSCASDCPTTVLDLGCMTLAVR